jgi:hypothetical protein
MSWTGTLEFVDLGTGQWVLNTDKGDKISLYGDVPKNLTGQRVQVSGKSVDAHGFAMVGAAGIEVSGVQKA